MRKVFHCKLIHENIVHDCFLVEGVDKNDALANVKKTHSNSNRQGEWEVHPKPTPEICKGKVLNILGRDYKLTEDPDSYTISEKRGLRRSQAVRVKAQCTHGRGERYVLIWKLFPSKRKEHSDRCHHEDISGFCDWKRPAEITRIY